MFFNRISFRNDWFYSVTQRDAERRTEAMLETLTGLSPDKLVFKQTSSPEQTWVGGKWSPSKEGGFAYVAEDNNGHVIEVVDQKPKNVGWCRDKGDIISIERLVSIYDKDQGAGSKGTIFMRISPNFAPSINVLTNQDGSNAGFIDKGDNRKGLKRKVRKLLQSIERQLPDPPWTKTADAQKLKQELLR